MKHANEVSLKRGFIQEFKKRRSKWGTLTDLLFHFDGDERIRIIPCYSFNPTPLSLKKILVVSM